MSGNRSQERVLDLGAGWPKGASGGTTALSGITLTGADTEDDTEKKGRPRTRKKTRKETRKEARKETQTEGTGGSKNRSARPVREQFVPSRGWPAPGGGRVGYMDPPTMWRATTVQACGLWPFAAGSGAPMTGVPLGQHLYTGATVCGDPLSLVHPGPVHLQPVPVHAGHAGPRASRP